MDSKQQRLNELAEEMYSILSEEPTMDLAAMQLADIYLTLMQRLMTKFGNPPPPSRRRLGVLG
jgi:hypothetical protein